MKSKLFLLFTFFLLNYSITAENVLMPYLKSIPSFCKNNYKEFETLLDKEANVEILNSDYDVNKPYFKGIKTAKINDKNGDFTITYRTNTNTNQNEVVYGFFLDSGKNAFKESKNLYNDAKNSYDLLLSILGEPKVCNDLGFLNFNEDIKNHSISAEWFIGEYKVCFNFFCVVFSEYYNYITGPFISIEDKNLNKDLQPLIKVNLHQISTYYYLYKETRNQENDQYFIIDLNQNSVFDFETLNQLKCDVSSTDSTITLKFDTGEYIFTYYINRYTGKYYQTTYVLKTQRMFEKASGDVVILNGNKKF